MASETIMTDQKKAVQDLEARANTLAAHIADIDFVVGHKDLIRAFMLIQAINGEQNAVGAVKDALRHGEDTLLKWAFSTKNEQISDPGFYVCLLSVYAICELDHTRLPIEQPPYADMWAISVLIEQHYEPDPFAPHTREQLIRAMKQEGSQAGSEGKLS